MCLGARLLPQSYQYLNLSEGADRVGGQLCGYKECPFSGITKSGRVWRKVPESIAQSVHLYVCVIVEACGCVVLMWVGVWSVCVCVSLCACVCMCVCAVLMCVGVWIVCVCVHVDVCVCGFVCVCVCAVFM